jgi:hypothetical protein
MFIRKAATLAALSSFAFLSTAANAREACWYPNEIKASQLVDVQTKIMVGTLHCRWHNPSVLDHYGTFSTNHSDFLEANHIILRARFAREEAVGESDGQPEYNRYLTSAANHYSESASIDEEIDCAGVASLAKVAAQLPHDQLLLLAASIVKAPNSGPCPPSNYNFSNEEAPAAALHSKAQEAQSWRSIQRSLEEGGPAATKLEPKSEQVVLTSQASAQPSVENPNAGSESRNVAANTMQSAEASPPNSLQDAVVALQAATAALQEAVANQKGM